MIIRQFYPFVCDFVWLRMQMQLWAEMNSAVHEYSKRCLAPTHRVVFWHGEDDYGLRGKREQESLQRDIANSLQLPPKAVSEGFGMKHHRHRRLSYGDYRVAKLNDDFISSCISAAVPGAMGFFDYMKGSV